ncbi:MAG: ABC transporter ATP-binding protein [Saprospiraceae bacterium]
MSQLLISKVSKTYSNGVKALDEVSLSIPKGMYGLLGPNGAGKSTLMRTLATLQDPDEGSIRLGVVDVLRDKMKVRRKLGYLPQEFGLYPRISAEALLTHLALLKGITNKVERQSRVDSLLHRVNLFADRKRSLGTYSGGMKQRFGIAQALLTNPELLIVDEPTAGLDPLERTRFHNLLSELAQDSIILFSTHLVADVQELCSKMAIVCKGQVLVEGSPLELLKQIDGNVYEKSVSKEDIDLYRERNHVISDKLFLGNPMVRIYAESNPGQGFVSSKATLEDLYFFNINAQS